MRLRTSNSLRLWLSRWLTIQTFAALGLVCTVVYISISVNLASRQASLLQQKREVIEHLVEEFSAERNFVALDHKLTDLFYGKSEFSLKLMIDGAAHVYGSADNASAKNQRQMIFSLPPVGHSNVRTIAELYLDTTPGVRLRRVLAWTLFACALIGAFVVSLIADVLVRRALAPINDIAQQATLLSPDRIGDRLSEGQLPQEIKPLVRQFNAVLQRLERAYLQMEGFNADVAHELRTPLATLVGETELALSGKRSSAELFETLGSNLEELQRMTAIVNDMLFLSQADRGAQARAVRIASLKVLIAEVIDYHGAEALDANVFLKVTGDQAADVDRSLFQRAVSNLVTNAIRYSTAGSDITVTIEDTNDQYVRITVRNTGELIDEQHLPQLFHRFYRLDSVRADPAQHHGLGLAIVAAIARMHGGKAFALSHFDGTSIGFTISLRPNVG